MAAFNLLCLLLLLAMSTSSLAADGDATTSAPFNDQYVNDEHRLVLDVTSKVDPNLRPVNKHNDTVTVNFGVTLIQMMEVDEKKGMLTMHVWKKLTWTDPQLTWNPADYGGISSIRIPASKIWKPDITLYNSGSGSNDGDLHDVLALVYSIGMVIWIAPSVITSQCSFDLKNFPNDDQVCEIKFGSWVYDGFLLDIEFYEKLEDLDVTEYLAHTEWNVKETRGQKNVKYYACCKEPYPDLTFELHLTRKGNYLGCMYIGPPVLISIMLPFIFILPALGTSRYIVGISGLIVMGELIEGLHELFPLGKISLLSRYYMSVFCLNFLVIWVAVLITSFAYRSRKSSSPPGILRSIFIDFFGSIFCVPKQPYRQVLDRQMLDISVEDEKDSPAPSSGGGTEWMIIACVMDRLCCLITIILIIILACAFIPR